MEVSGQPNSVYRSADRGVSWSRCSDVFGHERLGCVAADPDAAPGLETMLLATHETGVFASEDLGQTWTMRSDGLGGVPCRSLAFGASGSGLLYAGANSIDYPGLFRSRDMGKTWAFASAGLPGHRISSICTHPADDRIVFAIAGTVHRSMDQGGSWVELTGLPAGSEYRLVTTSGGKLFACLEHGLYRSDDNGDTWHDAGGGVVDYFVRDLTFDPRDPQCLFAGFIDGIARSRDGGASWNKVITGHGHGRAVAAAPGGDRIFAGLSGLHRSLDGGDTWAYLPSVPREVVAVSSSDPMTVVCAGSPGAWISRNGGESWFSLPGLLEDDGSPIRVEDLAFPPAGPHGEVLFAATDHGAYRVVAE
jgi:photosystem II stability/assembly factor-like uncharacterized protein